MIMSNLLIQKIVEFAAQHSFEAIYFIADKMLDLLLAFYGTKLLIRWTKKRAAHNRNCKKRPL